ncbi:hypothetical protein GGD81_001890 [Rhodobium orientis]|nr:hypothetical protein [Rhodobium orientis]MBB4302854.1 hypothetical protein [Rhodobium orientis]
MLPTIDAAEEEETNWVSVSRAEKTIIVDFERAIAFEHAVMSSNRNRPS